MNGGVAYAKTKDDKGAFGTTTTTTTTTAPGQATTTTTKETKIRRFGHYIIWQSLGKGNFARVYLAKHKVTQTLVRKNGGETTASMFFT